MCPYAIIKHLSQLFKPVLIVVPDVVPLGIWFML